MAIALSNTGVETLVQKAGLHIVEAETDFLTQLTPDQAAQIWLRNVPNGYSDWVDAIDPDHLPFARVIIHPTEIRATLQDIIEESGLSDHPCLDWLKDDIAGIADRFVAMMKTPWLRLRLDVIDSNACRKFHQDRVTARLICSYRGTGTQLTIEGADEGTVLATLPTGVPVLTRGSLWPATTDQKLLHRSPPIEGTGETRLVLVLDPVSDPDDAF